MTISEKIDFVMTHYILFIVFAPIALYIGCLFLTFLLKNKESFLYSILSEFLTISRAFLMIIISYFIIAHFNQVQQGVKLYFEHPENTEKTTHEFFKESARAYLQKGL